MVLKLGVGDGRKGLPQYGPYDVIHVGGALKDIPKELIDQLAPGGIMIIPKGIWYQSYAVISKNANGEVKTVMTNECTYNSLMSVKAQLGEDL